MRALLAEWLDGFAAGRWPRPQADGRVVPEGASKAWMSGWRFGALARLREAQNAL